MRTLLLTAAILLGMATMSAPYANHWTLTAATVHSSTFAAEAIDAQQQQQQPPAQVNVEIKREGRAFRVNPMWIAIGAVAVVVLILLIGMALRGGGGTTVVRG